LNSVPSPGSPCYSLPVHLDYEVPSMAADHPEGFLKLVRDAKTRVKQEDFRETKRRLDAGEKIIVVDTREDSEWARGHIPGAIHLGKGVIERDIEKTVPDKEATLVLYCGGGFRSALAAERAEGRSRNYCNGSAVSSDGPNVQAAVHLVAGSGPRPSANAASSMRAPRSIPGKPKLPSWHRGS